MFWFFLSDENQIRNRKGSDAPYSRLRGPLPSNTRILQINLDDFIFPILSRMFGSSGVQKLRFPHGLLSTKKAIKDHKERPMEGGLVTLVCAKLCQTRTSSPWPGWSMGGKMEMYLFDVVRRTNQNSILFDLFLHLITHGPRKSITTLSPCHSALAFGYRGHTMLCNGLSMCGLHLNYDLDLDLELFGIMPTSCA